MATAFVTGGSGFVGGRLVRRLRDDGWEVRALARSDASAERVAAAGAEPVRGSLEDPAALTAAAAGCEAAFHAAAEVAEWGRMQDFVRANVEGTRNALEAARAAGVRRFVHVGTESALMRGQALRDVDEGYPLAPESPAPYAATKAQAERLVRDAAGEGFDSVVVRPRLVWGPGDTTLLPAMADAVRSGRFRWIGGGRHLTSTTHVDNTVHGLVLAAERGRPGAAYFVTDGEPVEFREFVTRYLATAGVQAPGGSLPAGVARVAAAGLEGLWRALRLKGSPPLTRTAFWLSALECTLRDDLARAELGYAPVISREEGLRALEGAGPPASP